MPTARLHRPARRKKRSLAPLSVACFFNAETVLVHAHHERFIHCATQELVDERVNGWTLLFLTGLFLAERRVAEDLACLNDGTPSWGTLAVEPAWYLPGQSKLRWLRRSTVMTGSPGVGETTVVNMVLRILGHHGVKTTLCAPTGRAAKRLSESTGQEAKTIHQLLASGLPHGVQAQRGRPAGCRSSGR